ncbi:hypothetical protein EV426DRAFT_705212 [Tirmania nivea]|nr:hypothetical protein EV426DRAFT_705212 [Tirmania nivea]
METFYPSFTSQSLPTQNPIPSLSQSLLLHNSTARLPIHPSPDILLSSNPMNTTNSTGDQSYLGGDSRVYLWTLTLTIPLILFMLYLDCLECLPWHKGKRKKAEGNSQSVSSSNSTSPPQNLPSTTCMNSRSLPANSSQLPSKVRFAIQRDLEAQISLEQLELDFPGSRISLSLPEEGGAENEEDDGYGPAKEERLQAMLDFLNAK